jgi:glucose/arabinose dehydrogenase
MPKGGNYGWPYIALGKEREGGRRAEGNNFLVDEEHEEERFAGMSL